MDPLIKIAARLVRDDQTGPQAIRETTLSALAIIPSRPIPTITTPAWQVCARYPGKDDTYRIVAYRVMAANADRARSKAASGNRVGDSRQWEPFPESAILSVDPINALAEFAVVAAQLVDSSRHNAGFYEVDPTLLKQAKNLAVLVCQQLV